VILEVSIIHKWIMLINYLRNKICLVSICSQKHYCVNPLHFSLSTTVNETTKMSHKNLGMDQCWVVLGFWTKPLLGVRPVTWAYNQKKGQKSYPWPVKNLTKIDVLSWNLIIPREYSFSHTKDHDSWPICEVNYVIPYGIGTT
jgi:hypothetical protein